MRIKLRQNSKTSAPLCSLPNFPSIKRIYNRTDFTKQISMEPAPSAGRPEKDPEERRSKFVHMRTCPSHKTLIELEAERRNASKSLVVERIGFEEIQPTGRPLPRPSSRRWLREKANKLWKSAEEVGSTYPQIQAREFGYLARDLARRQRKRERLWENAQEEKRDVRIGIRLKPGQRDWLDKRASQENTARSSLLRARLLEGIERRNHMSQIKRWAKAWEERGEKLAEKAKLVEKSARSQPVAKKLSEGLKSLSVDIDQKLSEVGDLM